MRAINQKATKIFDKIVKRMNGDSYLKIGEDGTGIMPLVVEKLATYDAGTTYSFAHYFKQNGDLCQDPEMVFLKHANGKIYPMMFQQAIPPIYQESLFKEPDGWKVYPRMQKTHAVFAGTWLENIKHQQTL